MKRIVCICMVMCATLCAMAQQPAAKKQATDDYDLWTRSLDVPMNPNWRKQNIVVAGKGTPTVIDFLRAYAKANPSQYYKLLLAAIDGDKRVKFNHESPRIEIDRNKCFLSQGNFAMRVFYKDEKPVALGISPLTSISSEKCDAYFYRYDAAHRLLKPYCQASDLTGGTVKRKSTFSEYKDENHIMMSHSWGRCGLESRLVWDDRGNLTFESFNHSPIEIPAQSKVPIQQLMFEITKRAQMELRDPKPERNVPGGSILSLPICVALRGKHSEGLYAHAYSMEGSYYFDSRGWKRSDGSMLAAVLITCAPDNDLKRNDKSGKYDYVPHTLGKGDEIVLQFYNYNPTSHTFTYIDPKTPQFATSVGTDIPSVEKNQWRVAITHENEKVVFINQKDSTRLTFRWNGTRLQLE